MTILSQITRSFNWLRGHHPPLPAHISTSVAARTPPAPASRAQCGYKAIKAPRHLDASWYEQVISAADRAFLRRQPKFEVDLSEVEQIDLMGIFALHCVAMILRGETIPDPELGWYAIRMAAERNLAAGRKAHLTLTNASPQVAALLRANHLDPFLAIKVRSDIREKFV